MTFAKMKTTKKRGIKLKTLIITLAILSISACSQVIVVSAIGPDGNLTVLNPSTTARNSFSRLLADGKWVIDGDPDPGALVLTQYQSTPALKFTSDGSTFSIVRPIAANLMATPFLDWSWNMTHQNTPYHGVSLMVGIRAPEGSEHPSSPSMIPHINGTIDANRIISIRWSKSALARGNLIRHPSSPQNSVIYTARGGRENSNMWWRESIDLSDIYSKSWPNDSMLEARIVFIALKKNDTKPLSPAYFSTIKLFR